jgi:membrane protease YdiL (CAAX protease family)
MKAENKQRLFEIIAVLITGAGKFVFMDWLNWRAFYVVGACLFWIGFVLYRYKKDATILEYWGFTKTNFKDTFLMLLPLGIISVATFFIIGNHFGTIIINKNIIPILLLYPVWGVIQQFIVVALVAGNLRDMDNIKISKWAIILLTSLVFAVVHFPFLTLVGGTFLLALVYTTVYLKKKNLYVLGLYHGWLGAFYFYTIVGRDPWAEVFGVLGL